MKNLLLVFILISNVIFANDIVTSRIKSEVISAIVYLDGAEVKRSKTVELKKGKNELIFEGLSPKLNPRTIQVNAPEGVDILSVTSKINYLSLDKDSPHIQQLKDSVDIIQRQIGRLNDEKGAYDLEKDLLVSNKSLSGKDKGVPVAELKEAADFYRQRLMEINGKSSEIIRKMQKLNMDLNKINNQLNEANNSNSIQRGEISILINCTADQKIPMELRYLVAEIGWIPTYDIKATEINMPVQLIYRAKVLNNSDINWNNVQLTLSSADQNVSSSKPGLTPWYLNYRGQDNAPQNAYSQNAGAGLPSSRPESQDMLMDESRGVRSGAPQAMNTFQKGALEFTNIAISDINAEFVINEKYSIPSDAKPYFIKIKEYQLQATFKHYSVPKQSCDVFLLARITGWEDLDILEGTANIYLNGTFTGQSFIDTRNVDDTLDLSLGRDNKVVVKREKQMDFSSSKLIGSNRKETFAYEIIIKNNHKVPVDIEVVDQLPVPQDSDIEVDKIELSGGLHNDLNGEVRWNYRVSPAEIKKFNLSFAIKYPKSKPINTRTQKYKSVIWF